MTDERLRELDEMRYAVPELGEALQYIRQLRTLLAEAHTESNHLRRGCNCQNRQVRRREHNEYEFGCVCGAHIISRTKEGVCACGRAFAVDYGSMAK